MRRSRCTWCATLCLRTSCFSTILSAYWRPVHVPRGGWKQVRPTAARTTATVFCEHHGGEAAITQTPQEYKVCEGQHEAWGGVLWVVLAVGVLMQMRHCAVRP